MKTQSEANEATIRQMDIKASSQHMQTERPCCRLLAAPKPKKTFNTNHWLFDADGNERIKVLSSSHFTVTSAEVLWIYSGGRISKSDYFLGPNPSLIDSSDPSGPFLAAALLSNYVFFFFFSKIRTRIWFYCRADLQHTKTLFRYFVA